MTMGNIVVNSFEAVQTTKKKIKENKKFKKQLNKIVYNLNDAEKIELELTQLEFVKQRWVMFKFIFISLGNTLLSWKRKPKVKR